MDAKIILKNYVQHKQVDIFHQVFQCPQYYHLKIESKYDLYRDEDCMKSFVNH